MSVPGFKSLADYLAAVEPVKARTLKAMIDCILAEFPELEAKIAWNVPQIHRRGNYVAGMAAFKAHLTFSPWSVRVIDAFRARLAGYVVLQHCFHIPVDWQVDGELLRDMVRARLAEPD